MSQIDLPSDLATQLANLSGKLGIGPTALAIYYLDRQINDAQYRHNCFLDAIEDHGRIKGWLPDGSPILRD